MLPGIELRDFAGELGKGGGSELKPPARNGHPMKPKFHAGQSSSALAVNAFGPPIRCLSRMHPGFPSFPPRFPLVLSD
jgi:hypothetical protein